MDPRVKDPVCGTKIDRSPERSESYGASVYYFCSETCRDQFRQNPQDFISQTG
jgi:YHS domain-containing protein